MFRKQRRRCRPWLSSPTALSFRDLRFHHRLPQWLALLWPTSTMSLAHETTRSSTSSLFLIIRNASSTLARSLRQACRQAQDELQRHGAMLRPFRSFNGGNVGLWQRCSRREPWILRQRLEPLPLLSLTTVVTVTVVLLSVPTVKLNESVVQRASPKPVLCMLRVRVSRTPRVTWGGTGGFRSQLAN